MRARWPGWRCRAAASAVARRPRRSPALRPRSANWSRSWPRPASWWMCRQNCTRSWGRSPRARTPSRGRRHDRPGRRRTRRAHRRAGWVRRHRRRRRPATTGATASARHLQRPAPIPHRERPQPRALSAQEQQAILDVLHSDRFVDMSPAEVWATLLDEGVYLGSQSPPSIGCCAKRARCCERRRPSHPSREGETRTHRQRAKSGVVVGHNQVARPSEMDLLLPLRDLGHLSPATSSAGWSPAANPPRWPRC